MALCKGGITWNIKPDSPFFKKIHSSQLSSTGGEDQATVSEPSHHSQQEIFRSLRGESFPRPVLDDSLACRSERFSVPVTGNTLATDCLMACWRSLRRRASFLVCSRNTLYNNTTQTIESQQRTTTVFYLNIATSATDTMPQNHRNSASSKDMFKQLKEQIRDELREEVKATFTEQVFEEMLATALSLKNDWEEKMNSIRRIGVRLNEHGQDEVYEYPLPLGKVEACMSIAAEVVRRADPTNTVIQKCYAPDANQILDLELELEEFDSVISYMRKQRKSYASPPEFSLTYNVCIKACLSLRAETVRFLLSHPFYVIAGDNLKKVIRQEYIHFFDRVFTSQMVDLMGIVSLWFEGDCDILKLPADQLFNECEGLVTGGNDHMSLKERNRRTLTSYN